MMLHMPELTATDFEGLGLYDPNAPHAAQQLELLEYLVGLGATADDLVIYRDELPGLATVMATRGGSAMTLQEAVERSGISEKKLLQIIRAAGLPQPGPGDHVIGEQFVGLAAQMAAAEAIFGGDAVLQLVRVMGSAMARLADALISAFLVNVESGARDKDPVGLSLARANADAVALLPAANAALDVLLRQHILAARRSFLGDPGEAGFETRPLCVCFVDLVGSTALARRLSTRELGAALTEFEHVAADTVTSAGGRLVKLIGDEVLYTASDEASACAMALRLAATFNDHPLLPPVRAGVASGEVLLRDGDVFGPVVNLAARAVKVAEAGEVVTSRAVAEVAGIGATPLERRELRGFDDDLELCRLLPPACVR
jgi:class 3 adenylate cyclase